jgi:hypothetical protein
MFNPCCRRDFAKVEWSSTTFSAIHTEVHGDSAQESVAFLDIVSRHSASRDVKTKTFAIYFVLMFEVPAVLASCDRVFSPGSQNSYHRLLPDTIM